MGRVPLLIALAACGLAVQAADAPFRDTAVISAFRRANPQLRDFKTVSRTRADDSLDLLLVRGSPKESGYQPPLGRFSWDKDEWLGLLLQERERPGRVYQLSLLPNGVFSRTAKVLRASSSELILALYDGLDRHDVTMQFFLDPRAKALVKRIDSRPFSFLRILQRDGVPLLVAGDTRRFLVVRPNEATGGFAILSPEDAKPTIAALPVETWTTRDEESVRLRPQRFNPLRFGPEERFTLEQHKTRPWGREWSAITEQAGGKIRSYPLPQSAYAEFAKARPGRVRDGYRQEGTQIAEEIGPAQFYEDRLWFGKTFYDSEGMTGIGALGYFDIGERKFTLYSPPEIRNWSVSALLVEPDAVWLGLANRSEYTTNPGGLLKWSLASQQAQLLPIEAGINAIERYRDRLLLATDEGISVLTGESFDHYLLDQTIQGRHRVVKR
jgi:hypothetical protein